MPLQRSPEIIPLHRPAPELPASRPLPLATDAPTDILTATLPPRPIPPVTLPPPADETRLPDTVKGTLLVELQLLPRGGEDNFPHAIIGSRPDNPGSRVGGSRRGSGAENGNGEYPSQDARAPEIGNKGGRSD